MFHADGRLAEGPIALVELQGYVYAAKRLAAACARELGKPERAAQLEAQAEDLRRRFDEAFWCEEIGTYALALDGAKAPCKVRTSNAGHALATGIALPHRARRVAAQLMQPSFYSGWGIRTVAKGEARYNPMSYHNGSIWPHDNALIAHGLAQYGGKREHRRRVRGPGAGDELHGQPAHAGALLRLPAPAGARPHALSRCLLAAGVGRGRAVLHAAGDAGPLVRSAARHIRLVNPSVPAFAGDITVRNLSLAGASVDFVVRQDGEAISLQVLRTRGDLQVSLVFNSGAGNEGQGAPPSR